MLLDQALSPNRSVADAVPVSAPTVAVASPAAAAAPASKEFDPANYSLVTFDDPRDLYKLLTQEGRCPPNKLAEPKQPCALILYTLVDDTKDGRHANFKPVFKVVSKDAIWAIHDKKLQKVGIENLYHDEDEIIGAKKSAYRSVALIGNAENKANCEQTRPCLASLVVSGHVPHVFEHAGLGRRGYLGGRHERPGHGSNQVRAVAKMKTAQR